MYSTKNHDPRPVQKPDIDIYWLEKEIKDGIMGATVRLPNKIFRVQLKLWEMLEGQQRKALIRIAHNVNVKLEVVL